MTIFQLDECISMKKLIRTCREQGFSEAYPFPNAMKNKGIKDPEMLQTLLPLGNPILTTDKKLMFYNLFAIPEKHPGIIVIGTSHEEPRTLKKEIILKILSRFKSFLPQWHTINWSNSIVLITEKTVQVWHKVSDSLKSGELTEFEKDASEKILGQLINNST